MEPRGVEVRESVTPPRGPSSFTAVSVIVPVHNYARYVAECVGSILRQRDVDLDVIVIDDASSDRSGEVIAHIKDPRVRVLTHAVNWGHIPTYLHGISIAASDVIVIISADDLIIGADSLAAQARALQLDKRAAFAYSAYQIIDSAGDAVRAVAVPPADSLFRSLIRRSALMHSGTVFRRDLFNIIGGFDSQLTHAADWDLWLRFLGAGFTGAFVPEALYAYRMHGKNMHQRSHSADQRSAQRWVVLKRAQLRSAGVRRGDLINLGLANARDCLRDRSPLLALKWIVRGAVS